MVGQIKKLLLIAVLLLVGCNSSVSAAQEGNVYDQANLLTEVELRTLNENITALSEETGWNIYAVTTSDAQGKSATAYADDFFDEHSPEQEDGVALLIDMDNREITISTCGEAIRYLTDTRIDVILDKAYINISNGEYGACLTTMADGVAEAYRKKIETGQYNYDSDTGEVSKYKQLTAMEAALSFGAAAAAGVLVFLSVLGSYRMKRGNYKYEFRENARIALRVRDDRFVNQVVTHRRIPKQTTTNGSGGHSSGRSTTHRSSSGRSHGGGSRKF